MDLRLKCLRAVPISALGESLLLKKIFFHSLLNKRVVVKTKTADLSSPGHCESIKNINNRRGHRQC